MFQAFGSAPTGSWADEEMPLPNPTTFTDPTTQSWSANKRDFPPGPPGSGHEPPRASRFPPREQIPVPDHPPFTARLANLEYAVKEEDIEELLNDGYKIVTIRLPKDAERRSRGFALAEFEDKVSLEKALTLDGLNFHGRELRVLVSDRPANPDERFGGDWRSSSSGPLPPLDRPRRDFSGGRAARREMPDDSRDYDNWERRGPLPPLESRGDNNGKDRRRNNRFNDEKTRDFDNWETKNALAPREDHQRPRRDRRNPHEIAADSTDTWRRNDDRPPHSVLAPGSPVAAVTPGVKPKIQLAPRTVGVHDSTPEMATGSRSIFGAAKPVDTTKKLLELEQKQQKSDEDRRVQKETATKAREEEKKRKEDARLEQTRKRFDVLKTEDDEEEAETANRVSEVKQNDDKTAAQDVLTQTTTKEEVDDGNWEQVSKRGGRK